VVIFIIIKSIWLRLPGLNLKNPAQQQAANVSGNQKRLHGDKNIFNLLVCIIDCIHKLQ
jgi:hypothetical protein